MVIVPPGVCGFGLQLPPTHCGIVLVEVVVIPALSVVTTKVVVFPVVTGP